MALTGSPWPRRLLLATFIGFAFLFLLLLPLQPFSGSYLIKAVPAASLAMLAAAHIPGRQGKLLAAGFLFSTGGDIALELDRDNLFVVGLALFLVAHLFYIAAFLQDARLKAGRRPAIVLLLLYSSVLTYLLWPALGALRLPVLVYIVVITAMGMVAAARPGPGAWLVVAGAFLFILSDSLIAINRFLRPVPANRFAVMSTYYSAQFLIAYGMLAAVKIGRPAETYPGDKT